MKQTAAIKVFKFQSFSEMLNWIRQDWRNRIIFYQNRNHALAVFLSYDEKTGKHDKLSGSNVDTFHIVNGPYDDEPDVESLEEYFGENDEPLDDMFAQDYKIDDFFGEEYAELGTPAN